MALEIFTDGKNERKQRRRTENETLVLFRFFLIMQSKQR